MKVLIRALCLLSFVLVVVLFVPPVRDWFFATKMWPFATPWDVTAYEIEELRRTAQPGDVIAERNLHSWQWMLLCNALTGSSWVHVGIVDRDKRIVNMSKTVQLEEMSTYLRKQSTDMRLLRPPYANQFQVHKALDYAKSKIGTPFDPSFANDSGNCTGLIAKALEQADIHVRTKRVPFFGKDVYPGREFFDIPGVRVIWSHPKRENRLAAEPTYAQTRR